jgi:hypothetical protein
MRYFQTDESGYLVGEFDADQSPLEPGAFLIPRGGVTIAPPAVGAEQAARWTGAAWEIVPDLRGRVYWLADHSRHEITERGIPLPAGALAADPPKTQAELDAEQSAIAKAALREIDIASIRSMREWIAAQPTAPAVLKNHELAVQDERAKLKP